MQKIKRKDFHMNLKTFIKAALADVVGAIEESSNELNRSMRIEMLGDGRLLRFKTRYAYLYTK